MIPLPWTQQDILEANHVISFEHDMCWCQPRIEHIPPESEITIHRHFWDRPEYSEETTT